MPSRAHHYAWDHSTFDTYHVTGTQVSSRSIPLTVPRIGTVTLELVRSPNDPRSYTLVLKDVLHIPTGLYNGIIITPSVVKAHNFAFIYFELTEVFNSTTGELLFYAHHYCGLYQAFLAGGLYGILNMLKGTFSHVFLFQTKIWRCYTGGLDWRL